MADSDFNNNNEIAIQSVQQRADSLLRINELITDCQAAGNELQINHSNLRMFEELLRQASQILDPRGELNSASQQHEEGTVEFSCRRKNFLAH